MAVPRIDIDMTIRVCSVGFLVYKRAINTIVYINYCKYKQWLTRVIQFACKRTAIHSTVAALRELFIA
jgi:hypothetical protein